MLKFESFSSKDCVGQSVRMVVPTENGHGSIKGAFDGIPTSASTIRTEEKDPSNFCLPLLLAVGRISPSMMTKTLLQLGNREER